MLMSAHQGGGKSNKVANLWSGQFNIDNYGLGENEAGPYKFLSGELNTTDDVVVDVDLIPLGDTKFFGFIVVGLVTLNDNVFHPIMDWARYHVWPSAPLERTLSPSYGYSGTFEPLTPNIKRFVMTLNGSRVTVQGDVRTGYKNFSGPIRLATQIIRFSGTSLPPEDKEFTVVFNKR